VYSRIALTFLLALDIVIADKRNEELDNERITQLKPRVMAIQSSVALATHYQGAPSIPMHTRSRGRRLRRYALTYIVQI